MHIDMKLNFMHILADLGFGGISPIHWIKKDKHAIKKYVIVSMHAKTFENQMRYTLDKTPSKPRGHTKVWHKEVVQNMSKIKSTHDWGQIKSTNDWFQNTSTHEVIDINRNRIEQHMSDKTPIENKIPARGKYTKRRLLLERHKVK